MTAVDLAGMDVVEVAPAYDLSDVTAAAAHRCVMEAISAWPRSAVLPARPPQTGAAHPQVSGGG